VLCEGISERMNVPVLKNVIIRTRHTQTQTKKGRVERWENIEGKFKLIDPAAIINNHVLLVDDVVTTGATLEACGQEILQVADTRLSIATLCYTARY
jgi:predicted amidophosphoribosyltransferase